MFYPDITNLQNTVFRPKSIFSPASVFFFAPFCYICFTHDHKHAITRGHRFDCYCNFLLMKIARLLTTLLTLSVIHGFAAELPKPVSTDMTSKRGVPATRYEWKDIAPGTYTFTLQPAHLFSCLGMGWMTAENVTPDQFSLTYVTKSENGNWTPKQRAEADFSPSETPTGMYWTDAFFTHDATSQGLLRFEVQVPAACTRICLDLFDGNHKGFTNDGDGKETPPQVLDIPKAGCLVFPTIITRSSWCGGSAPCTSVNASYSVTYITPTHTVIHHGASPDTYTDGQAVVRSYWNYHVISLGWADIGYNYLVDKFGNFYQGRHNPSLPTTDVRGAHAGDANSGSIGINFLGNLDVTTATPAQLAKVNQLLGWWYDYKGFSPTSSASMTTQAYGVQVKPRITGHRDIGSTTCPGDDLHARLPAMRLAVQAVIDGCNDVTPPTTSVSAPASVTSNFTATFTDSDNVGGSGVAQSYYQVTDFDGSQWRANAQRGFFNDLFNDATLQPAWTSQTGTWGIAGGVLVQTNQTLDNTNVHAYLNHSLSNAYVYNWLGMIEGTGTNRRAGFHYFCSDPTQTNRGNSYFIFSRVDNNKVQLYKVTGNVYTMVAEVSYTFAAGQWYDHKVIYDRITGKHLVYIENALVMSWTDPSPLSSGNYVSFRSAECKYSVNNFRTFRSRAATATVTVSATGDMRYLNPSPGVYAGSVKSICIDNAGNISAVGAANVNVNGLAAGAAVQEHLGLADAQATAVLVYPNPFTDRIQVRLPEPADRVDVQIRDMAGRTVYAQNLSGGELSVDPGQLAKGVYMLYLRNGSDTKTIKLIRD